VDTPEEVFGVIDVLPVLASDDKPKVPVAGHDQGPREKDCIRRKGCAELQQGIPCRA
jgi:hypothetical protein